MTELEYTSVFELLASVLLSAHAVIIAGTMPARGLISVVLR